MASAGKFALLENVNHKGQTKKKKKKKKVGVDERTPINAARKPTKPEQNPTTTGKTTVKKMTATPAKKTRPKITKSPPINSNSENINTVSPNPDSNYENSLQEDQQWQEWKKKDEEVAANIFQSELEQAIALSRSDYQEKLDLQLNAWAEEVKQRKLAQKVTRKDDMPLKNGIQKHLHAQNCVESCVADFKHELKKINKPSQVEKIKVVPENVKVKKKESAAVKQTQTQPPQQTNEVKEQENGKPSKKSETVKQTQSAQQEEYDEMKLTKAQKKRLKKKLKSDKISSVVSENSQTEMNGISGSIASKSETNLEEIELPTLAIVQHVPEIATDQSLQQETLNEIPFADLALCGSSIKSQVDPNESELVLKNESELELKDCEIAGYKRQLRKYMRDVNNLKKSNNLLCKILAEEHLKEKAALLIEIDELTSANECLTKEIQGLKKKEEGRSQSEILQEKLGASHNHIQQQYS